MAKGTKPKKSGPRAKQVNSGKPRKGTGRTKQQEAFCKEYVLNGFNAAEAFRVAYPASATNTSQYRSEEARKLLKKANVKAGVVEYTEMMAEAARELAATKADPDTVELTQADRERVTFRLDADRVLQELAAIAFQDPRRIMSWGSQRVPMLKKKTGEVMTDPDGNPLYDHVPYLNIVPSDHLTEDDVRVVSNVDVTLSKTGDPVLNVKRGDKLKALQLLGTHLKLFTQKIEHDGKVQTGPISLQVTSAEEGV